jgi:hypothetical protein
MKRKATSVHLFEMQEENRRLREEHIRFIEHDRRDLLEGISKIHSLEQKLQAMKCDISKIFDRRMFEDIQQLNAGPDRQGLAEITCRRTLVRLHQTAWDYADALLLRDWLNRAFPADGRAVGEDK